MLPNPSFCSVRINWARYANTHLLWCPHFALNWSSGRGFKLSFVLGILIGGISGYYGGTIDTIIQRIIEFIRAVPDIPLWMALSAALPRDWFVIRIYFGITIILSLIG